MSMHLMRPIRLLAVCLLVLGSVCLSGCGPSIVTVSGKVETKGGTAVKSGSIVFHPTGEGKKYSGDIKEGKYEVSVAAGSYKVTIVASVPSNPEDPYSEPKSLVASTYNQVDSTPLSVEVTGSETKDFTDLHPR